jgi:hypothetical protein
MASDALALQQQNRSKIRDAVVGQALCLPMLVFVTLFTSL